MTDTQSTAKPEASEKTGTAEKQTKAKRPAPKKNRPKPVEKHFLILMRHGKASKEYDAYEDADRPLSKRGKKDAKIMRKQIAATDVVPDLILCSPAKRVLETYEEIAKALPEVASFSSETLYTGSASDILEVVRRIKQDVSNVMIIGHNPALADFAQALCDGAHSDDEAFRRMGKKFPTAAVAVMEITGNWADIKENSARLIAFARPADFKK